MHNYQAEFLGKKEKTPSWKDQEGMSRAVIRSEEYNCYKNCYKTVSKEYKTKSLYSAKPHE